MVSPDQYTAEDIRKIVADLPDQQRTRLRTVFRDRQLWPQPGPQTALCLTDVDEVFYGGARGGGKTMGALIDFTRHAEEYGEDARGVFFRRHYKQLEDVIEETHRILPRYGAKYAKGQFCWRWPNGAYLRFRHLERTEHVEEYMGHAYTRVYIEEAGNFPLDTPLKALKGSLRSARGVPCRIVLTGNPGGSGHNWLKARYIDPAPPLTVIEELQAPIPGEPANLVPWRRMFIPARVQDNPKLLENDPGYIRRLYEVGDEWLVKAWLAGDWDIVAGGMFDDVWSRAAHTARPFTIPDGWRLDRTFDYGASKPFSTLWFAEADGTEAVDADGQLFCPPRGTVYVIAEWYGSSGGNKGLNLTCKEIGKGIIEREAAMQGALYRVGRRPFAGAADIVWGKVAGADMAGEFGLSGVHWEKPDKSPGSRVAGADTVRRHLKATALAHRTGLAEEPGLYIFETCRELIAHLPVLPRDPLKPDDVDTEAEDHDYDALRMRLRPGRRGAAVSTFAL